MITLGICDTSIGEVSTALNTQIGECFLYLVLVKSDLGKDASYFKSLGRERYRNVSFSCFPHGASGKESACLGRRHKRCSFDPWIGEIS